MYPKNFKVSEFQNFKMPKFQSFKVSMIPFYQNPISCFLEDIDPTSKIFKNLLNGSPGFCDPPSFPTCPTFSIFKSLRFPNILLFKNDVGSFLGLLGVSWWVTERKGTSIVPEMKEHEGVRVLA